MKFGKEKIRDTVTAHAESSVLLGFLEERGQELNDMNVIIK